MCHRLSLAATSHNALRHFLPPRIAFPTRTMSISDETKVSLSIIVGKHSHVCESFIIHALKYFHCIAWLVDFTTTINTKCSYIIGHVILPLLLKKILFRIYELLLWIIDLPLDCSLYKVFCAAWCWIQKIHLFQYFSGYLYFLKHIETDGEKRYWNNMS